MEQRGTGIVGLEFGALDLWNGLDLTAAIRILSHAGRPDPRNPGRESVAQLQSLIDALCDLSMHDGLTGLVNATFFKSTLHREIDRTYRTGRPCALLLIDLDHFKAVNDTYGHCAGDRVLESVAGRLKESLRNMDTAARIGGEEFAVILPECVPECAVRAGLRIHACISPFETVEDGRIITITTSAGLVWTDATGSSTPTELLRQADRQLYRAKHAGRGRLCHPQLSTSRLTAAERRVSLSFHSDKEASDGQ